MAVRILPGYDLQLIGSDTGVSRIVLLFRSRSAAAAAVSRSPCAETWICDNRVVSLVHFPNKSRSSSSSSGLFLLILVSVVANNTPSA